MEKCCIETEDFEGIRTVFTEAQRKAKEAKHPELAGAEFIATVKRAIETPSFVYEDFSQPQIRRAHYFCLSKRPSKIYTKVVVDCQHPERSVVTAYEHNYCKERTKGCRLIHGKYV